MTLYLKKKAQCEVKGCTNMTHRWEANIKGFKVICKAHKRGKP